MSVRLFRGLLPSALMLACVATSSAQAGSAAKPGDEPAILSPRQYGELVDALKDREAGTPQSCISLSSQPKLQVISDDLLVYRDGRKLYTTRLIGHCSGLSSGRTLITRVWGTRLCRGDMAQVADLQLGGISSSCTIGDFIPYKKAAPPEA